MTLNVIYIYTLVINYSIYKYSQFHNKFITIPYKYAGNLSNSKSPEIFKIKSKQLRLIIKKKDVNALGNFTGVTKHFMPSIKEWHNSIYTYKKDTMKLLPSVDKMVFNIVKSYVNFYSLSKDKDARSRSARVKKRRLCGKRVLAGKPNFKHTNKNVTVLVYIYNRRIRYYANKENLARTINNVYNTYSYQTYIRNLKKKISKIAYIFKYRNLFYNKNFSRQILFIRHIERFLHDIGRKYLSAEINTMILKQLNYIEISKFDKFHVLPLINLLEWTYKKKVTFDFVNINYIYNNASILSESIVAKLRNKSNKPTKVLNNLFGMFSLPSANKFTFDKIYNKNKHLQNVKLKQFSINQATNKLSLNVDKLETFVSENFSNNMYSNYIDNVNKVIDLIKYKFTTGVRVEMAGRLTRRFTAQRSVFKYKNKGNSKNVDSSYRGLSTTLLRGHARSNVLYKFTKSKLRTGSFGVKSWITSNNY